MPSDLNDQQLAKVYAPPGPSIQDHLPAALGSLYSTIRPVILSSPYRKPSRPIYKGKCFHMKATRPVKSNSFSTKPTEPVALGNAIRSWWNGQVFSKALPQSHKIHRFKHFPSHQFLPIVSSINYVGLKPLSIFWSQAIPEFRVHPNLQIVPRLVFYLSFLRRLNVRLADRRWAGRLLFCRRPLTYDYWSLSRLLCPPPLEMSDCPIFWRQEKLLNRSAWAQWIAYVLLKPCVSDNLSFTSFLFPTWDGVLDSDPMISTLWKKKSV